MKRWNWIDILIVLILVAAAAFAAMKFVGGDADEPTTPIVNHTPAEQRLRIVVSCTDVTRELAENIIASLESEPRNINGNMVERTRLLSGATLLDGHVTDWEICEQDGELVELRLTVESDVQTSNTITLIGIQEIRIGNSHFVKTVDIEIQGTIVSMTELAK